MIKKTKNNNSKLYRKKISELDQRNKKLIEERKELFDDNTANNELNRINKEITSIEFDITFRKLSVTESTVEKMNLLKKEKLDYEKIVKSKDNRIDKRMHG